MKKYAALWLIVLILASKVSSDHYIWITLGLESSGCFGFPLEFDHEPSGVEVFAASTFPIVMRVYDTIVLLLSEAVAKNHD